VVPVAGDLDAALVRAARSAAADRRFPRRDRGTGEPALVVTLLHDRERLGELDVPAVARKLRHGRDAFSVHQAAADGADRVAVFLESVVCQYDWTGEQAARALLAKAGVTGPPHAWVTYKAASWLGAADGVHGLAFGVPERAGDGLTCSDTPLLAGHLAARLDADGWPAYRLHPVSGRYDRTGTAARCLHGLDELAAAGRVCGRPDWVEAATQGLRHALSCLSADGLHVPGHRGGPMADACLLAAASRHGDPASPALAPLAARLRGWLRADGSVRPGGVPPSRSDPDFLPGAVLLALARHAAATDRDAGVDWPSVRAWYARRFRLVHPWGLAAWHAQLWAEVAGLTGDNADAEFCLELADWMTGQQLEADGSYLTDLDPTGASFHTAFVAEGVAAAWRLSLGRGDAERAAAYGRSWRRAMTFVDRLVVRSQDCYWMPEPAAAVGGVRGVLGASELRIDYTSHALQALLIGAEAARGAAAPR
jgi:hypothetical protein